MYFMNIVVTLSSNVYVRHVSSKCLHKKTPLFVQEKIRFCNLKYATYVRKRHASFRAVSRNFLTDILEDFLKDFMIDF